MKRNKGTVEIIFTDLSLSNRFYLLKGIFTGTFKIITPLEKFEEELAKGRKRAKQNEKN